MPWVAAKLVPEVALQKRTPAAWSLRATLAAAAAVADIGRMRRLTLEGPRAILGCEWPGLRERGSPGVGQPPLAPGPARDRLGLPAAARARRRALFDPARGWLRRSERWLSHVLTREVYPRIPGMERPYERCLRRDLTVSEAEIGLAGLPQAFDGLRLLLVSDPHAGPFVSPGALGAAFERLLAVEPDVVLLGGDLVSSGPREFESHRRAFERLRAPLGVWAVLGNHDHYAREPERLREMVEAAGIGVLHNRSVPLGRGGARLDLAGVDDLLLGRVDLDAALAGTVPPVVLLSHNPDLLFEAARRGVALQLSGHTHGGQIRIPGGPVLVRQSRFRLDEGRYRAGATELVVSRGLGAVALPFRCGATPEAVLVRLRGQVSHADIPVESTTIPGRRDVGM